MAVYMIAYELHEGEDYEGDLIKAIKALPSGGSWHNLDRLGSSSARKLRSKSTIH